MTPTGRPVRNENRRRSLVRSSCSVRLRVVTFRKLARNLSCSLTTWLSTRRRPSPPCTGDLQHARLPRSHDCRGTP